MQYRTRTIPHGVLCLMLCLATAQCHHRVQPQPAPTLENINPAIPQGVAIALYQGLLSGDRDQLQSCIEVDTPSQQALFEAICEYAGAVNDLRTSAVRAFGSNGGIPHNLTDSLQGIPQSRAILNQGAVIVVSKDGDPLAAMITVNGKWKISLPMQAKFAGESVDELTDAMQKIAANLDQYRDDVEAGKYQSLEQLSDAVDAGTGPPATDAAPAQAPDAPPANMQQPAPGQ